jgi:hypothetical protein
MACWPDQLSSGNQNDSSAILSAARMRAKKHCCVESKRGRIRRVKYWEIIADNLSKAGWSWGCVSTVDSSGRTHRNT